MLSFLTNPRQNDDATVTPFWLREVNNSFKDKRVFGMGGKVNLVYSKRKPSWISKGLELYLSKLNYPTNKFKIVVPQYIVGANMAFRKSAFKKFGYFLPNFGRIGNKLLSGEELEFCLRLMKNDKQIVFNSNALVRHHISSDRLNRCFFLERSWWQGITEKQLSHLYKRPNFGKTPWLSLTFFEVTCILVKKISFRIGN